MNARTLRMPPIWTVSLPLLLALVLPLVACSGTSSAFGQYYRGRTLDLSLVTMERVPELLYRTTDSTGAVRHFRIRPLEAEQELVLLRVKVENHTATSAIVNIDGQAAELRDFFQGKYFPIDVNDRFEELEAGPANPSAERSMVFLWNATLEDGTSPAFVLQRDFGIDGWMVFEAPRGTKFREFRWRAGDTLSIEF